jgi:hypothetical protein
MKTTYKTIVLIVVLMFLLSPAALALIWPSGELQWDNGGTSTTISNGDSVSFTTGLFASADPIYATVKLIDGANIKVLLNDQQITSPYNLVISPANYNHKMGEYTITITLDDKYSATSAQTHSLNLDVVGDLCGEGSSDYDCDGVLDYEDNCYANENPNQEDADNDGYGDVCDNCINDENILQTDTDNDGEGNACDLDDDNDGILDVNDNCQFIPNTNQADNENDGVGDVCDPDDDNDVIMDEDDNCAMTFNPDQSNVDGDGWGDACDSDADNDGIYNWKDNCPLIANTNQADTDNDGIGDVCDSDSDGDGTPNDQDLCPNEPGPATNNGCPEAPVNQAPEFIDDIGGNYNLVEGGSMALQFEIEDDEFNTLTVGVKKCLLFGIYCFTTEFSEPYSLAATAKNNYLFSWQPDYTYVTHPKLSQSVTLVFTASDGNLYATKTILVKVDDVNQMPALSINGNDIVDEGESLVLTVTATDGDAEDELSFVVNGLPEEWVSSQQSGNELLITGTSDCDDSGKYEFDVVISDGLTSVSETYQFSVTESCELSCLDIYGDTDGDGICDEFDNCPLTANPDQLDSNMDGIGDACTIVVVNHAPRIAPLPNQEVTEGNSLEFEIGVTDSDGDEITLELASRIALNKNIVLGPHPTKENVYVFQWKTYVGEAGDYFVTFVAKDEHGANSSKKVKITILVLDTPCLLDTDEDGVCDEDDNCPLTANPDQLDSNMDGIGDACEEIVCLVDTDNDGVCDEDDNCPLTANLDQLDSDDNGVGDACEVIPCLSDADNDGVCDEVDNCPLTANPDQLDSNSDGIGDLCTIVIVNQAPVIYSQPVTTVTEDEDYSYQLVAADPEGEKLIYYLSKAPEGMTIGESGLVEWEPTDNGKAKVLITVSDGQLYAQQQFTIGVSEAYKNIKLATVKLSTEVANAGEHVSLQVNMKNNGDKKLKDLKVTALVYDLGLKKSGGEFDLKAGQQKSKNLVLQMPYNAQPGDYLVKVTVTNSEYHESTYRLLTIY